MAQSTDEQKMPTAANDNNTQTQQKWTNFTFTQRFQNKMARIDRHSGSVMDVLINKSFQLPIPFINIGVSLPVALIIMTIMSVVIAFIHHKISEDRELRRKAWLHDLNDRRTPSLDPDIEQANNVTITNGRTLHDRVKKDIVKQRHYHSKIIMNRQFNKFVERRRLPFVPLLSSSIPVSFTTLVDRSYVSNNTNNNRKPVLPNPQDIKRERERAISEHKSRNNKKRRVKN